MPSTRAVLLAAALAAGLSACGGDDLVLPSEGQPATIAIVQGDGQSGRVGERLPQPLILQVNDAIGRPVAGAMVVVELDGADAAPDTVATDAAGRASVDLRLGPDVGPSPGSARVLTAEGQTPVAVGFSLSAVAASANGLTLESGDNQTAPAGAELSAPLVVRVGDAFGNAIAGVEILWTAVGGGAVSEASTISDADGRAAVRRTLGSASGQQSTLATSDGLAGSPIVFLHTATPGSAAGVSIVSGNDQSGAPGSTLPAPLVARVTDADGNPVNAAAVTWVVTAGGGSLNPVTSTTDLDGRASSTWTLGSAEGANSVAAVVSGVGQATFRATATAGGSSALAFRTQPSTDARIGERFGRQPVVQLSDASGNDVAQSGVPVTAAVASGGGTLGGTITQSTDANGRAAFQDLVINGAGGDHTLSFTAPGYTSVTSNTIAVSQGRTTTRITGDLPDPSAPGQVVAVSFTVSSDGGTPDGTVTITAAGGSETCSAPVSAGGCALVLNATGNRTLTARYAGSGQFGASDDNEGHRVEAGNTTPTAQDDAYSTREGGEQTLVVGAPGVLGNDQDDGGALTAELVDGVNNGTLSLDFDGGFRYTPGSDFSGGDSFTYRAVDGTGASDEATVQITVEPVNDSPRFTRGPDQSASASSEPIAVESWATNITAGPNEAGQSLQFLVEVQSGGELFASAPAIAPNGTLTYDPAAPGTATVVVRLQDDGGTGNDGRDTSDPVTVTFTFGP
ncbi:MAG: Ig-like domain-containing protein [Gemmatimonadota bacterium]|nr:Ig-like domain-containing protein [Gemmatimonadota bacterium]